MYRTVLQIHNAKGQLYRDNSARLIGRQIYIYIYIYTLLSNYQSVWIVIVVSLIWEVWLFEMVTPFPTIRSMISIHIQTGCNTMSHAFILHEIGKGRGIFAHASQDAVQTFARPGAIGGPAFCWTLKNWNDDIWWRIQPVNDAWSNTHTHTLGGTTFTHWATSMASSHSRRGKLGFR